MAMLAATADTLAAGGTGELTVTVLVYDYTRLPASELGGGMTVAQGIFRNSGVATKWVQCAAVHESGQGSGCLEALGSAHVIVNIVRSDWRGSIGRKDRIGTALQDAKGRVGVTAYVFQQGVEQALQLGGCDRVQILGHVMAHEVGHLLLGTESHSETGIMHPSWAGSQMARDPGSVTFTPDQARRIRVDIKDRMQKKSVWGAPRRSHEDEISGPRNLSER
jgi:hypothetical protein